MADLVRNNPATPEGKYLVTRRDGTIPEWPFFVIGAQDPIAPWALRVYALVAFLLRYDKAYCLGVWRLARQFAQYRKEHGTNDPSAPPTNPDDPATVLKMKDSKGA